MLTLRLSLAAVLLAATACAQPSRTLAADDWCDEVGDWNNTRETVCEVRETMLRADALDLAVQNGAVTVRQWDRADVLVRARVVGMAGTEDRARALVEQTEITTAGGRIRADEPRGRRNEHATVSFEVYAPAPTALRIEALNGPVHVEGMTGRLRADVTNGPVALLGVSGDVEVEATNGPVSVDLGGDTWRGAGLAVRAMNGPITVEMPRRYSARLAANTDNGPIVAPGLYTPDRDRRGWRGDRLDTTLGDGGALLSLDAHNGPVRIRTAGG